MNTSDPQTWFAEYEAVRYLRKATPEQLERRYKSIIGNLWSTDKNGNVTPPRDSRNHATLRRLLFDVIAERTAVAGGDIEFDEKRFREEATANYSPAKLTSPFEGSPVCFAKFGKKQYIRKTFEEGSLKVSLASGFNDASLNPAQRDDELMHLTATPNKELLFKLYGLDEDGKEVEMPVEKKEYFEGISVPDFYVWCCGLNYDARLFHDFEADAVIVIRDKEEFKRRLDKAVNGILPNSEMVDGPLSYYDPYTSATDQIKPIFTKNFHFLHQNEYRFAWKISEPPKSKDIFPVLGPLSDISEYYEVS